MDKEDFQTLIDWHRATQRQLGYTNFLLAVIFAVVVIVPALQQIGII